MKVSIITVCLNAAATIEQTLKSVNTQTYNDIEHIIVDGRSTDNTLNIINKYSKDKIVLSEPDNGIYNAMNKGIELATGKIIYFLNADDYLYDNNVIYDVANLFKLHPEIKLLYGDLLWKVEDKFIKENQNRTLTRQSLARKTVLHQTIFTTKDVFISSGNFSECYKIVSDYDWILRVLIRDKIKHIYYDRCIAVMGTGGKSWTTNWEDERISVMKQYFSTLEILKYRRIPMMIKRLKQIIRGN